MHCTVFHSGRFCRARKIERHVEAFRNWLFAIDMLARRDGFFQKLRPHLRGTCIEKNRIVGIGQSFIEIVRPAFNAILFCQMFHLRCIPADQNGIRHQPVTVR